MRWTTVCVAVLATGLVGGAHWAQATGPASSEPFFFSLSPIRAIPVPGQAATRYQASLSGVPAGDAPSARWYIDLKPDPSDSPCSDELLAGARRLSPTRYVWANQGDSFLWFHGPVGSYPSDPAYGCDQAKLGRVYPGTVTVVFENDFQTCKASFSGVPSGRSLEKGPSAVCELGGSLPLAVPRAVLQSYAKTDQALTSVIARIGSGKLRGSAEISRTIDAILQPENSVMADFFPPIWGCRFDALFDVVLATRSTLNTAAAMNEGGLAADRGALRSLESVLRACRPSAGRPVGTPATVISASAQLAARAAALQARPPGSASVLRADLVGLDDGFERLVKTTFPAVFGMPYSALVDRVRADRSAVALASQAVSHGNPSAAVSALRKAASSQQTTGTALRKQEARSTKAAEAVN
jgi:hypothetical protein